MDGHTQRSGHTAAGEERPERLLPSALKALAGKARTEPQHRFGGLYSLLNISNLRAAYHELNPKASPGIDRVDHAEYGRNLEENVTWLVEQLKGKRYHAKLIRRVHIPKGPNTTRPLGVLCISDKVAQRVASRILEAIYEQDFLDFSFAFRPHRDPRKAIRRLRDGLMESYCEWVVELDIQSYYDTIGHDVLVGFIERRVSDRAFVLLSVCPKTSETVISNGCERSVVQSLQHKQISPFSRNDNKKGFRTDTTYQEMASSRSAGERWKGRASGDGDTSRRRRQLCAGQHLSPLYC
jgi:retron-type reverse transcriptase